jgi:drug/metabolite transporter (DMT)-like permease
VLFASRDNLVRWLDSASKVQPLSAAAAALLGGASVTVAYRLFVDGRPSMPLLWRGLRAFGVAGLFSGFSYVCLFEAFERGRVSVVSPLVATESLWGVVLSFVVFKHSELVGKRVVAGAVLVVAGGALIGATQ